MRGEGNVYRADDAVEAERRYGRPPGNYVSSFERAAFLAGVAWGRENPAPGPFPEPGEDLAVEAVAAAFHRPGCNHHTGGPAECDSRAMTAVMVLRRAGFLPERGGWL